MATRMVGLLDTDPSDWTSLAEPNSGVRRRPVPRTSLGSPPSSTRRAAAAPSGPDPLALLARVIACVAALGLGFMLVLAAIAYRLPEAGHLALWLAAGWLATGVLAYLLGARSRPA